MAEIRLRDVPAQLMKELTAIQEQLKQATITGTVEKLIPRYHDMGRRIKEQNEEIAKLVRELRAEQHKYALAQQQFADLLIETRDFARDINNREKEMTKRFKTFGTKRGKPGQAAAGDRKKIVPQKKKQSPKK